MTCDPPRRVGAIGRSSLARPPHPIPPTGQLGQAPLQRSENIPTPTPARNAPPPDPPRGLSALWSREACTCVMNNAEFPKSGTGVAAADHRRNHSCGSLRQASLNLCEHSASRKVTHPTRVPARRRKEADARSKARNYPVSGQSSAPDRAS